MKKIILLTMLSLLVLSACSKDNTNEEDLGKINTPEIQEDKNFVEQDKSVIGKIDIYNSNNYKSFTVGENINIDNVKDSDVIVGKMFILSQTDLTKFDEKEIKYVKGDIDGLLNSYHKLVSRIDISNIEVVKDEKSVMLNFKSFNPMLYVTSNQLFHETYMEKDTKRTDLPLKEEAKERVLEGYYKTVKANFPDIEYVYFQYLGNPWEAIAGQTHDGLLFMEPGQTKPPKAPERLFKAFKQDSRDTSSGWSINYSGDRNLTSQTQSVAPQNNFSNGGTYINNSSSQIETPEVKETKKEGEVEILTPEELEKRAKENPVNLGDILKDLESMGEKLTPEEIENLKKQSETSVETSVETPIESSKEEKRN